MQELDDMKIRLKEMEEEATALRQMHAKAGNEMASKQGIFFFTFLIIRINKLCDGYLLLG